VFGEELETTLVIASRQSLMTETLVLRDTCGYPVCWERGSFKGLSVLSGHLGFGCLTFYHLYEI